MGKGYHSWPRSFLSFTVQYSVSVAVSAATAVRVETGGQSAWLSIARLSVPSRVCERREGMTNESGRIGVRVEGNVTFVSVTGVTGPRILTRIVSTRRKPLVHSTCRHGVLVLASTSRCIQSALQLVMVLRSSVPKIPVYLLYFFNLRACSLPSPFFHPPRLHP